MEAQLSFFAPRPYTEAIAASERAKAAAEAAAKLIPPGFVRIEAGESRLGSPADEADRFPANETEVVARVTRPYLFKSDRVTQGEYEAVMGYNPSRFTANLPDGGLASQCPVERLDFYHALRFANEKSIRDGLRPCYDLGAWTGRADAGDYQGSPNVQWNESANGWRLPTVAEFVRAARAETRGATYVADQNRHSIAHYDAARTRPVGQETPNAWGVRPYGNVYMWAWDWYQNQQTGGDDPKGPDTGSGRVVVGGGWGSSERLVRAAYRSDVDPWNRHADVGLCLARSLID